MKSLSFDSIIGVWYPDEISALSSFIAAYCLWDKPSEREARGTAMLYLMAFLVNYLFNVDRTPKFYTEEYVPLLVSDSILISMNREEIEFDIKHRAVGLQRIALLPWTEDNLWI